MDSVEGTVIFVQENRFQLVDHAGVAHHFILSHASDAEPDQLSALQNRQARVRVIYRMSDDLLARVAQSVTEIGA